MSEKLVQFGPFALDQTTGQVKRDGQPIRLAEQPTRVLLALLEKPGEIVSHEELRYKLWSNDTNVEFDHGIHAVINKLRHALGDSPEQPRFIETIPRRGYRLIASVTTGVVSSDLEHSESDCKPDCNPIKVPSWRNTKARYVGVTLLTVLVIIAGVSFRTRSKIPATVSLQPAITQSVPSRIAIVGFQNLSNRRDADWLSTAFAEMLATELATSADLQPVSGEDIAQMKRELAIGTFDSYTQQTLSKIQQSLGAQFVLNGSFMPIGHGDPADRVRFDVHLLNTNTGQTVVSLSETGRVADLFDLISDAGLRLRLQLGVTPLSSSEQAEIRRSMPKSGAAEGLYFSGLEKIRSFDYKGAREILTKAVVADPKNCLAHEALSISYGSSGYELLGAKEAKLAFDLAKGLTYEEGLQIEGRYYETKHAWARAEEAYQRLRTLSPHTLDFGLRLAHIQAFDGKPQTATATLESLRGVAHAPRDEAQIDLAEAFVRQQAGDFKKQLVAAKAAATEGQQAQSPLVVARALRSEGLALGYLGESTQALNLERQAEKIFETLQDPGGQVDTLIDEGDLLSDLGDMGAAERAWQKALALARSTGRTQGEAVTSMNLANALLMRGEPEQSLAMYKHSYGLFVKIQDKTGQASSLLTIGDAWREEGRLLQAKEYHGAALQLSTQIVNDEVKAEALEALAGDLADLGESARAKGVAQEAVTTAQASGDKATEATALIFLSQAMADQGALAEARSTALKARDEADAMAAKSIQAGSRIILARILLWQGELDKARSNYEQALSLAQSVKANAEEREARYALAEFAIEEQRSPAAREALRWLQADLKRSQNMDVELECLILQTRLELLDQQKNSALSTAIRAQSVSGRDNRLDLKMSAAGALVKAAAASQKWKQADQVIGSALLQASQSGCLACELKARLSACELKYQENAFDASLCFVNLHQTAASKGFGGIAKNAASLSPSHSFFQY